MEKLSFDEIEDSTKFEDLVYSYFKWQFEKSDRYHDVSIEKTGTGPDGGVDILLNFKMKDEISVPGFQRRWVIQCKFINATVGVGHMHSLNIPTLIHSKRADGYLLVVKKDVSSILKNSFQDLRNNCRFGHEYRIWDGATLLEKIQVAGPHIHELYFPRYHRSKFKTGE